MRYCASLVLILGALASSSAAQTPLASSPRELDTIALEVFKEMHNRGAELYNAGDATGCLKVYATALLTAKPFLKHRPAIQKLIDDGLAEAEKADGAKLQAFGLHKLFLQVRAELETAPAKVEEPKSAQMFGVLTLDGKPVTGASITIAWKDRAFTATTDAEGKFAFTDALPLGKYAVIITGAAVPVKYGSTETTDLAITVVAGKNVSDLALKSK
jgi:hypothetical protein